MLQETIATKYIYI